jgi:hypothetical protein
LNKRLKKLKEEERMTEFLLPIVSAVVLIFAFMYFITRGRKGELGAFISGILFVFLMIIWFISYYVSIGDVADMRSFVDSTKSAYEHAIISTQEVEIKAVSSIESSAYQILDAGDLAYLKLGSQAGERIKELRAKVEWYNRTLERYKRYKSFWISQGFIIRVPADLMPISFK